MFEDEAGFGRISDPIHCWAPPKQRPSVPSQRVRQYKTVYGAVSPIDGERIFVVLEKSNSENMNIFLKALSEKFPNDIILLCLDRASWHTSTDKKKKGKKGETEIKGKLVVPKNIVLFHLPPRSPEMNPIEQIWKEIRKRGFKNKIFGSIEAVVAKFHEVIDGLENSTIISITLRDWIESFYKCQIMPSILDAD